MQKKKENPSSEILYAPKYNHRMVFTAEMEHSLEEYVLQRMRVLSGVNVEEFRVKAYELAERNKLKIPESWRREKKAGVYSKSFCTPEILMMNLFVILFLCRKILDVFLSRSSSKHGSSDAGKMLYRPPEFIF